MFDRYWARLTSEDDFCPLQSIDRETITKATAAARAGHIAFDWSHVVENFISSEEISVICQGPRAVVIANPDDSSRRSG